MIKGEDLIGARTLSSMYDHQNIEIMDKNNKTYRISATEILAILQKFNFSETKARVHTYLSLA